MFMGNLQFRPSFDQKAPARLAIVLMAGSLFIGCSAVGNQHDAFSAGGDSATAPAIDTARILIIGQDLGAIRGYMASECCPTPDGLTAYVDFYDILTPDNFGGLGLDLAGEPTELEFDWGAGAVSAYKTATEFGINGLAIGLSITENEHPGGLDRIVAGKHDSEIRQLARFFSMIRT